MQDLVNYTNRFGESCYYGQATLNGLDWEKYGVSIRLNYINDHISQYFIIPGIGVKPVTCCGAIPKHNDSVCSNTECAYIKVVQGNCKSAGCPDCYMDWILMRAKTAAERILSYKLTYNTRAGHFVVSLSQDQIDSIQTLDDVQRIRKKVRRFLLDKGVVGAVEILHPFRIDPQVKTILLDYRDKHYPDLGKYGIWKSFVEMVHRGAIKDWREWLTWSPHFHFVGVFTWTREASADDPFVFKKVGADRRDGDIIKTVMYLYSHIGIDVNGGHNIRWIGQLAGCRWSFDRASLKVQDWVNHIIESTLGEFKQKDGYGCCPVCGAPLLDLDHYHTFIADYHRDDQRRIIAAYSWLLDGRPRDEETIDWISKAKKK